MAEFFTTIMDALKAMGMAAIKFLPPSPFLKFMYAMESQDWLKYLNWIIPISSLVTIMEAWLVCVATFYIYQLVLRWAKAIE